MHSDVVQDPNAVMEAKGESRHELSICADEDACMTAVLRLCRTVTCTTSACQAMTMQCASTMIIDTYI